MKDNLILFIIGVLVGAVISTGAFYIYTTTSNSKNCSESGNQMNGGQPPQMQNGQNNQNGQPPEKPGNDTTQENNQNNN